MSDDVRLSTQASSATLLTAPGTAALAVVRLRGPLAVELVRKAFDRPVEIVGRCVYGRWRDEDEVLDDPLVVRVDEETFDLNLHGGRWIVTRLLRHAEQTGLCSGGVHATLSPPQRNDPTAPTRADVERLLPLATTEAGVRLLCVQPTAWQRIQDDPQAIAHAQADQTLRRLLAPATVALVGSPNVGKSTLANRLFGTQRSIVADLPGTTRDWVGHAANLNGLPVHLVDTPGRRATSDAIERDAITLSGGTIAGADLVILLLDATRPSEVPDDVPNDALRVANKCDHADASPVPDALSISAATGEGMDKLIEAIHERLGARLDDLNRACAL